MIKIPNYRPRKGDVVHLRATVKHDVDPGETNVFVEIEGNYGSCHPNLTESH